MAKRKSDSVDSATNAAKRQLYETGKEQEKEEDKEEHNQLPMNVFARAVGTPSDVEVFRFLADVTPQFYHVPELHDYLKRCASCFQPPAHVIELTKQRMKEESLASACLRRLCRFSWPSANGLSIHKLFAFIRPFDLNDAIERWGSELLRSALLMNASFAQSLLELVEGDRLCELVDGDFDEKDTLTLACLARPLSPRTISKIIQRSDWKRLNRPHGHPLILALTARDNSTLRAVLDSAVVLDGTRMDLFDPRMLDCFYSKLATHWPEPTDFQMPGYGLDASVAHYNNTIGLLRQKQDDVIVWCRLTESVTRPTLLFAFKHVHVLWMLVREYQFHSHVLQRL